MTEKFRLTLAQLKPTVGDLAGNRAKALSAWTQGKENGADLVALPEMFLSGYQAQDLVRRRAYLRDCAAELSSLAEDVSDGPALAIGCPIEIDGKVYNAYSILREGRIAAQMLKHLLPNDDVFDEVRLFEPGPISGPYRIGNVRIGSPIL